MTQSQTQRHKSTLQEEEELNISHLKTMGAFSTPKPCHLPIIPKQSTANKTPSPNFCPPISKKANRFSCFPLASSGDNGPPLVVVGSANADIYVEIERLPKEGETVSAKNGQTLAGGKGANQAVCGGKLAHPTYFVGQVGKDAHGKLITEALEGGGVILDHLTAVADAPTGHAVVMLQSDGQNSIIIVGGANMACWPQSLDLEVVEKAGIVLLQREIPDSVNLQVAKVRIWASCVCVEFRCVENSTLSLCPLR